MKTIITLSALALLSNLAIAENFAYEQQFANPDLSNQDYKTSETQMSQRAVRVSLNDWYSGNPDVVHVPYHREGVSMKSKGNLISNYDALSQTNNDLAS